MQTSPKLTRIGPYQVLTELGEGAHLAKLDGPLGVRKLVVVKVLNAEIALTPLAHTNVAHVYGVCEEQGRAYLATEYVDGQAWARVRRVLWERDALPEALHVKVLLEVLSGLHHAHEQQIVHGDVRAHNVVVSYDGAVKVIDFGVTRDKPTERRADVAAVGVMLWEALTRRRFVERQNDSVVPEAPSALADICDRALDHGYATAAELRDALLGYVGEDMRDADRARLGELVQEAFQRERARLRAVTEPRPQPTQVHDHQAIARKLTNASRARRASPVKPERLHWSSHVSMRELRRGALPWLVIGVAVLSFAVTWLLARPEPQAVVPAAAKPGVRDDVARSSPPLPAETSVNASSDVERTAPPNVVHLTVSAHPDSATLTLDGVPLSDNPFSASVLADHQLHTIRASSAGLVAQERVVRFDRDQVIELALEPRVLRTGAVAPHATRKPQSPSAAPEAPAASSGTRVRSRPSDEFDAPLRVGRTQRPIYEEDPYAPR